MNLVNPILPGGVTIALSSTYFFPKASMAGQTLVLSHVPALAPCIATRMSKTTPKQAANNKPTFRTLQKNFVRLPAENCR